MSNPFYDLYSHGHNTGELLCKFLVDKFEHITKNGRMCVLMMTFSLPGFRDQCCSATPHFVTNMIDIRGLHSAKGHCYLQYSQLYFASFEITS
jgi:hypothetical protein